MESEIIKVILTLAGLAVLGVVSRKWNQTQAEAKHTHKENFPFPMAPTMSAGGAQRRAEEFASDTASYDDDMGDESTPQYTGVNTARTMPESRYVPIDSVESAENLYTQPNGLFVEGGGGGQLASSRSVATVSTDSDAHKNTGVVEHPAPFSIDLRAAVIYSEILEPKFKSY